MKLHRKRAKSASKRGKCTVKTPEIPPVDAGYQPLPGRPIRVSSAKAARRLLSKIIGALQRGEAADARTRLLIHSLQTYLITGCQVDFEERLSILEKQRETEEKQNE